MRVRWQVEIDEWCRAVLAKHWPNVTRYSDARTVDPRAVEPVDVLCGGFPCQPISRVGHRRGTDDPRWLWPVVRRFTAALRPRYLVVENVPDLLRIHNGGAFAGILRDLAALGYDAEWESVSAGGLGAPHLRERVFLVAWRAVADPGLVGREGGPAGHGEEAGVEESHRDVAARRGAATLPDPDGVHADGGRPGAEPLRPRGPAAAGLRDGERALPDPDGAGRDQRPRDGYDVRGEPEPPDVGPRPLPDALCDGLEGVFSARTAAEHARRLRADAARTWAPESRPEPLAHGVPDRVEQLRAYGNAVLPHVGEFVGRCVVDHWQREGLTR